ncbi:hypothetical protein ACFL05_00275 [Patescibacteria group bacterium]
MDFLEEKGVMEDRNEWSQRTVKDTSGFDLTPFDPKNPDVDVPDASYESAFFTAVTFDKCPPKEK